MKRALSAVSMLFFGSALTVLLYVAGSYIALGVRTKNPDVLQAWWEPVAPPASPFDVAWEAAEQGVSSDVIKMRNATIPPKALWGAKHSVICGGVLLTLGLVVWTGRGVTGRSQAEP